MNTQDLLKSMLNNKINDNHAQAELDLHDYLAAKMFEIANTKAQHNSQQSHDDFE